MDDSNYTLSDFVRQKRKAYGLTQSDVAEKSGVGLRFVRELEQGKSTLRIDKVNQLLYLFNAHLTIGSLPKSEAEQ